MCEHCELLQPLKHKLSQLQHEHDGEQPLQLQQKICEIKQQIECIEFHQEVANIQKKRTQVEAM